MRSLARAALAAFVQVIAFGLLAALVVDGVPLVLRAGEASVLGASSLTEALGGVDELEVAIGVGTINRVLAMDDLARDEWLRALAPDVPLDPRTGLPSDVEPDGPVRPDTWPFEGRFGFWSRPAFALASAAGVELWQARVESRLFGRLDPLTVDVRRTGAAWLVVVLAPLLAFRLVGIGGGPFARRLARALVAACVGTALAYLTWSVVAPLGMPRLAPPWSRWIEEMLAAGRFAPADPWTRDNVVGLVLVAAAMVAAGVVGALLPRRGEAQASPVEVRPAGTVGQPS